MLSSVSHLLRNNKAAMIAVCGMVAGAALLFAKVFGARKCADIVLPVFALCMWYMYRQYMRAPMRSPFLQQFKTVRRKTVRVLPTIEEEAVDADAEADADAETETETAATTTKQQKQQQKTNKVETQEEKKSTTVTAAAVKKTTTAVVHVVPAPAIQVTPCKDSNSKSPKAAKARARSFSDCSIASDDSSDSRASASSAESRRSEDSATSSVMSHSLCPSPVHQHQQHAAEARPGFDAEEAAGDAKSGKVWRARHTSSGKYRVWGGKRSNGSTKAKATTSSAKPGVKRWTAAPRANGPSVAASSTSLFARAQRIQAKRTAKHQGPQVQQSLNLKKPVVASAPTSGRSPSGGRFAQQPIMRPRFLIAKPTFSPSFDVKAQGPVAVAVAPAAAAKAKLNAVAASAATASAAAALATVRWAAGPDGTRGFMRQRPSTQLVC